MTLAVDVALVPTRCMGHLLHPVLLVPLCWDEAVLDGAGRRAEPWGQLLDPAVSPRIRGGPILTLVPRWWVV